MSDHTFSRVAVLNRGEAAVRFMRAARTWSRMKGQDLDVVAMYTTPDASAPFVRMASAAVFLGEALVDVPGGGRRSAYLDVERIVSLCQEVGATALWPGWGFLAESAELSAACAAAGIKFIGPSAHAIKLLGDKIEAKRLAENHGVSVSDWSGTAVTLSEAREHADRIGYPVLLKAAAGGGGRGIRVVREPSDLEDAYQSASSEAAAAFGNDDLLVEQFVPVARHVEVQILADQSGTVWALGTRDCSMQRRHQKLIEEAPAPDLEPDIERALCEAGIAVAKASGYEGAGTAEFLLEPDGTKFYFLEMNTRLQVEHTVTEAIFDVDLVVKQIEIAMGNPLPSPEPPIARGTAVEVRLNAEDPDDGFQPSAGEIVRFDAPQGPGIRVDSGFAAGGVVPSEFDSNIAKIIAKGSSRNEAYARLETGLRDTIVAIAGGPTNRSLLLELVGNSEVRKGAVTTRWLDQHLLNRPSPVDRSNLDIALAAAAIGDHLRARSGKLLNFFTAAQNGLPRQIPPAEATRMRYLVDGKPLAVSVATLGPWRYRVACGDGALELRAENTGPRTMILEEHGCRHTVTRIGTATAVHVDVDGVAHRFTRTSDGRVLAAIPAAVTRVHVTPGQHVKPGDRLVTLEVMKMETAVDAPLGGVVSEVFVDSASRVAAGDVLLSIEGESDGDDSAKAEELSPLKPQVDTSFDPIDTLNSCLLGYDIEDPELNRALDALKSSDIQVSRGRLFELLQAGATQESLFQAGMYDDGRNDSDETSAEQLAWFVRHPHADEDSFSALFTERLKHWFEMHGLTKLRRSFALESALLRLFQTHHASKRRDRIYSALVGALIRTKDDAPGTDDDFSRRKVLERLANDAVLRNRLLAQTLWQAVYLLCDQPRLELTARKQDGYAQSSLETFYDVDASSEDRSEAEATLANLPLGTLMGMLPGLAGESTQRRSALISLLMQRIYETTEVGIGEPLLESLATVQLQTEDGLSVLGVFVPEGIAVADVVKGLPTDVVADLLMGYIPDPARLPGELEGLERSQRVSIIWGSSSDGIRSRTYVLNGGNPVEEELHRDVHPARETALEVNRLSAFKLERLSAPGGLFLARATAKDDSGDVRLFAIGEVERFDPEPTPDAINVHLPSFEKTYLDAINALRMAMGTRTARDKLVWNRLTLFIRPEVTLSRDQMETFAKRLGPPTVGLGLEKVVVRCRLKQKEHPDRPAQDMIVEWSNPTGRGPVLSFALPRQRPIRVLSEYERRVVDARRRGKFYPYELIRTLTSEGPLGGFAEGEFEEMDLDANGALISVYKRPYGQNTANLVVGRITNRSSRFSEGLTRMLVVGDPTRTMGSLAEPECRRVMAALDMAEDLNIPLEWVPISSGAKISFDSGTENLDWTARVLRRIVQFTQAGGVINIIVDGICVGAQSYWNAEATMLSHCRGTLIMTPQGCMLLTGKRALEYSGSVAASTNQGIGGLEVIMGPNGEAQYAAPNLREAYAMLFRHYDLTYVPSTVKYTPRVNTTDASDRNVTRSEYAGAEDFATIGDIFSDETNPGRKRPFAIRDVVRAVFDQDVEPLERWAGWDGAETSVVFHAQLGGQPVCAIGIESKSVARRGAAPADGPDTWTSGTLFPQSSRKVARAINACSGVTPVVVLANLSGFDGSPESLRRWQLEYGAEIGRAVVNFDGPIIFCVISRYHGGAYVVFSQALNENLESLALEGTFASVIGGGPAAAVVFPGLVRKRVRAHERVVEAAAALESATRADKPAAQAKYNSVYREIEPLVQGEVAREFDAVHSVGRAKDVGSLSDVISPHALRSQLIERIHKGVSKYSA